MPAMMPPRQQTGPAAAPPQAAHAPGQAPAPGMGNAAMQDALGLGGGDPQQQLRDKTDGASISVGGVFPGHLHLAEKDGNEIATGDPTSFQVGVARWGLFASFAPGIEVHPGSFWARAATGGVTLERLDYSFQSGKATVAVDTGMAGDFLDHFVSVKGRIEQQFASAFQAALPARLRQPGYDPYTDPDLPGLLQSVVQSLGSTFPAASGGGPAQGGPDLLGEISQPTVSASVSPKPIEIPLQNKLKLIVDQGGALDLTAHMGGNMKQALDHPSVEQLDVSASGVSVEHEVGGKLASIRLKSLVFGHDLSLRSMDYDLALEDVANALKLLGILVELRTGQDLGIHDQDQVKLQAIRDMIDGEAKQKLPELLREQVRANAHAIPGFDLTTLFGK